MALGTLHVILDEMEADGLIHSWLSASGAERAYFPRRVVAITPKGGRRLKGTE